MNALDNVQREAPFVVKIAKVSIFLNIFYLLFAYEPNLQIDGETIKWASDTYKKILPLIMRLPNLQKSWKGKYVVVVRWGTGSYFYLQQKKTILIIC